MLIIKNRTPLHPHIQSFCLFILIICFILPQSELYARNKQTPKEYIQKYKDLAIKEMKRTGIPASITLAQGLLESNSGNSRLARHANNHFGIKCHDSWNGSTFFKDDDREDECFRSYGSVYQSYKDHSKFLTSAPRYEFLFDYKVTRYQKWAYGLKKAGYATDPTYARRLIELIKRYELYRYDRKTSSGSYAHIYSHEINKVNHRKYIKAKEGDTYRELAKKFNMMPWEIYTYNDLPKDADITSGQRIFIQPKRNKASEGNKYHIVEDKETMYTISQKYGIKLDKLYKRNSLERGDTIQAGYTLYLRGYKEGFFKRLFGN